MAQISRAHINALQYADSTIGIKFDKHIIDSYKEHLPSNQCINSLSPLIPENGPVTAVFARDSKSRLPGGLSVRSAYCKTAIPLSNSYLSSENTDTNISNLHFVMEVRIIKNLILGLGLFVSTTTIAFAGSAVNLVSETGDWVGMGQVYDYSDTNSIIKISTDTVDGVDKDDNSITVIVKTPDADGIYSVISLAMRFAASNNDQIQPGLYSDIERYNSLSRVNPRMSIEAYSHGCLGVVGSFEVSDVSYDADGNADSLGLNFVQRCDRATSPALTGHKGAHTLALTPSDPRMQEF
jgi:hypothetical protein